MAVFEVGGEWVFEDNLQVVSTPIPNIGGSVGSYFVLQQITTPPFSFISPGYGQLYIDSLDNLVFSNSTGIVPITEGGAGWKLAGNSLGVSGKKIGSIDNFGFDIVANSTPFITLDVSLGSLLLATNASISSYKLGGSFVSTGEIFASNLTISASNSMTIETISSADIDFIASGNFAMDGLNFSIGTTTSTAMTFGHSGLPTMFFWATLMNFDAPQLTFNSPFLKFPNLSTQNAGGTYQTLIVQTDGFAVDAGQVFYGAPLPSVPWMLSGNTTSSSGYTLGTLDNYTWYIVCGSQEYLELNFPLGKLELNAPAVIVVGNQTLAIEYGSAAFSTTHSFMGSDYKMIFPTPPGANNTPLLIDTDGTIHY